MPRYTEFIDRLAEAYTPVENNHPQYVWVLRKIGDNRNIEVYGNSHWSSPQKANAMKKQLVVGMVDYIRRDNQSYYVSRENGEIHLEYNAGQHFVELTEMRRYLSTKFHAVRVQINTIYVPE